VDKFVKNIDWSNIKYEVLEVVLQSIDNFNSVLDELKSYANSFGYPAYAAEISDFQQTLNIVKKESERHIPDSVMYFKDLLDQSLKRGNHRSTNGSHQQHSTAQAGNHDEKVSQDKKNKKSDECWLCEKKIAKKKPSNPAATYCNENGFKGKYYTDKDKKKFGFTSRGTSDNGHYPWDMLKVHNNRSNASPMQHPLYVRCYDKLQNGRGYVRPQQIWNKNQALDAFIELKSLGGTDKDKISALEKNLQAHHIITVNEMKSNDFLFKKLPNLGYDLNDWYNIVVLPGIPELACFYEMPLHSGSHPSTYTNTVKTELQQLEAKIKSSKYCNHSGFTSSNKIVTEMKKISKNIYDLIMDFHRTAKLNTEFYNVYESGNKGCCNQLNHSGINKDLPACRHRKASEKDISNHHDFRTTKSGQPLRVPYLGKRISKLGY